VKGICEGGRSEEGLRGLALDDENSFEWHLSDSEKPVISLQFVATVFDSRKSGHGLFEIAVVFHWKDVHLPINWADTGGHEVGETDDEAPTT